MCLRKELVISQVSSLDPRTLRHQKKHVIECKIVTLYCVLCAEVRTSVSEKYTRRVLQDMQQDETVMRGVVGITDGFMMGLG